MSGAAVNSSLARKLANANVLHHAATTVQVLGAKGIHARSAVGTNALPLNVPVEIEAIVEIED